MTQTFAELRAKLMPLHPKVGHVTVFASTARQIVAALDRLDKAEARGRNAGLREAAEVAYADLKPKNPVDDWTEYAKHNYAAALSAHAAILALINAETDPQTGLTGTSEPQAATVTGADGYDQFWGALGIEQERET